MIAALEKIGLGLLFAGFATMASVLACTPEPPGNGDGGAARAVVPEADVSAPPVSVAVTSPVLEWLVRELLGDEGSIVFLGGAAETPPAAEQILSAASADLILVQGAGYEPWIGQVSLPPSRTIDTTADLELIELKSLRHTHAGEDQEHSHGRLDAAVWHDPARWRRQAEVVASAVGKLQEVDGTLLEQRWLRLRQRFEALESRLQDLRIALGSLPPLVVVGDGDFRYLADALGLRYESVEDLQELDAHELRHLATSRANGTGAEPEQIIVLTANDERPIDQELSAVNRLELDDLLSSRVSDDSDLLGRSEANLDRLQEFLKIKSN